MSGRRAQSVVTQRLARRILEGSHQSALGAGLDTISACARGGRQQVGIGMVPCPRVQSVSNCDECLAFPCDSIARVCQAEPAAYE
jgi:hypothetical protein